MDMPDAVGAGEVDDSQGLEFAAPGGFTRRRGTDQVTSGQLTSGLRRNAGRLGNILIVLFILVLVSAALTQ